MTQPTNEGWQSRFDKEFGGRVYLMQIEPSPIAEHLSITKLKFQMVNDIKSFISQEIDTLKASIKEEVENMKMDKCSESDHEKIEKWCESCMDKFAYNKALSDIINLTILK